MAAYIFLYVARKQESLATPDLGCENDVTTHFLIILLIIYTWIWVVN